MSEEVKMPQMGESIAEGTIVRWLKQVGESVKRDEPLFEISTDKVDAEIPAPAAGVLKEIKVGEGQTVPIQTVVAVIDADGAGAAAPAPTKAEALPAAALEKKPEPAKAEAAVAAPPPELLPVVAVPAPPRPAGQRIPSSPLVRRLAREHGIDLSTLPGTGAGGRISKKDIVAAIEARDRKSVV